MGLFRFTRRLDSLFFHVTNVNGLPYIKRSSFRSEQKLFVKNPSFFFFNFVVVFFDTLLSGRFVAVF